MALNSLFFKSITSLCCRRGKMFTPHKAESSNAFKKLQTQHHVMLHNHIPAMVAAVFTYVCCKILLIITMKICIRESVKYLLFHKNVHFSLDCFFSTFISFQINKSS